LSERRRELVDGAARSAASVVRPEYATLAEEFARIAKAFGHDVPQALRRDIACLAGAIERIDRHIDAIADDRSRRDAWRSVIAILDGARGDTELERAALDLRALADARGARRRVLRIVAKEARISEVLRLTRSTPAYVDATIAEGRMTVALALIVAGDACGPAFRRYFFRLGGPANLVDKLLDARGDHRRGEIAVDPAVSLHLRLAGALAKRSAVLLARPLLTAKLGVRYLFAEPLLSRP
jgi:hypothetical protein